MKIAFSDLWRWDGPLERGPYFFWGCLLMALKYNLDRIVALVFFDQVWYPHNYFKLDTHLSLRDLTPDDMRLYTTLVVLAVPFIWMGIVLTLRRLWALKLPPALVLLFFVPFVNLIFFLVLSLLPSCPPDAADRRLAAGRVRAMLDATIPSGPGGSAVLAIGITAALGVPLTLFGVMVLGEYGLGLFAGLPLLQGLAATLIWGYRTPRSYASCMGVAMASVGVLALGLLALAVEGIICLIMAAPIGVVLAGLGATIGYFIQRRAGVPPPIPHALALLLVALPLLMGAESATRGAPPVIRVVTSIEIDAPPLAVWRHVVTFSELPPPPDLIFRSGVAYPMRASISGNGVGAIRRCEFSTGAFVEPIRIWDEPHRLAFDVVAQPPAMKELSPWPNIRAPHLDNYMVSQAGEFLLTALPGGRTRLDGTTWYHHRIWPSAYWQVWSDAILHAIHGRVLAHVKRLAETPRAPIK